jgi:hypothetical protein
MSLTALTRSLLTLVAIVTALIVVAPTAHADCEYQGSRRAGSIDCIDWASEQTPGSEQTTGSEPTHDATAGQVNVTDTGSSSGGTSSPTCRDTEGRVVPCTTVNENGEQCYFSGAIGPAPSGLGGGAVYLCPAPGEDDEDADPAPVAAGSPGSPPVEPTVVAWQALASMDLHAVDMQIAPTPLSTDADSMGLVGLPVWLWTEPTGATWGPISASASDGPVAVSVTARIDRVEWNMGDGTVITCDTAGTPFDPTTHYVEDRSPDCGHVYQKISSDSSGTYTVTATSYWVAEWSSGGETGTIPFDFTTSEQIRIGELQVIRTARGE